MPRIPDSNRPHLSGHRRGSAIIFVVVVLALLVMMGAAWIQQARFDRIATEARIENRIDSVVAATTGYIQQVLKRDLLDQNDNFFNPAVSTHTDDNYETGADEPYDYPWTNAAADADGDSTAGFVVTDFDGNNLTNQAHGGQYDDTWLASTSPDFSGTNPTWPHLTNLTGLYLRLPASGGGATPDEREITNSGSDTWRYDTGVLINSGATPLPLNNSTASYDTLGADADGDGIFDSKWTWAPVKKIGGTAYIMAVRIIDNSAMINADTALDHVAADGTYTNSTAYTHAGNPSPRWYFPSELDMGNFVYDNANTRSGLTPSTVMTGEFEPLLEQRLGGSISLGTSNQPLDWFVSSSDARSRYLYWLNAGRSLTSPDNGSVGSVSGYTSIASSLNELELRYRNGLNEDGTTSGLENLMPTFLRSAATENTYTDVTDVDADSNATVTIEEYFKHEPRHQMTMYSGANIVAPITDAEDTTTILQRLSLNGLLNLDHADDPDSPSASAAPVTADLNTLANEISNFVVLPAAHTSTSVADFSSLFTACLRDYADTDNTLTEHDGQIGMEALPMITDTYVQRFYEASAYDTGVDGNGNGGNDFRITWTQRGDTGYAIELRNPTRKPLNLNNITMVFIDDTGSETSVGDLGTLASGAGIPTTLGPDTCLVVYRDSTSSGVGPSNNTIGAHEGSGLAYNESTMEYEFLPVTANWPNHSPNTPADPADPATDPQAVYDAGFDGTTVTVALRVDTTNSTTVTYCKAQNRSTPNVWGSFRDDLTGAPGGTTRAWYQRASRGNGNDLNIMAIDFSQFTAEEAVPVVDSAGGDKDRSVAIDSLGLINKTTATGEFTAGVAGPADQVTITSPRTQQLVFSDAGVFKHTAEIGQVAILGPTTTQTVREVWDTTTTVTDFLLNFAANSVVSNSYDHLAVNGNTLLLSRLITDAPDNDGVDNDGDSTVDNAEELFVPGTINLNTATATMLKRVLPIADAATRNSVVDAIIAYRDLQAPYTGANRNASGAIGIANYRSNPGIAHTGELTQVVHRSNNSYVAIEDFGNPTNSGVDDWGLAGGPVLDFTSNGVDETALDSIDNDGDGATDEAHEAGDLVADDAEEKLMMTRWIQQVASTRSDIFTAYVVIRGYPAADFRLAPVESAQYFVVFDRSGVTSASGNVRILAYYRFP
ncbi:MAG: hypothetical protein R3336_00455 [Phycisphaeraceae bacterium]|nr:hypothetical protein [Phycisphaeraceae bacterium]